MSRILQYPEISTKIAENLSILDFINFSESDNRVKHQLNRLEVEYFAKRLSIIFIKYDPSYQKDLLLAETIETNDLFLITKTNDPKSTVLAILQPLRPYLEKIRSLNDSDISDFDFNILFESETISSQDKAKVLKNLTTFVKIDDADTEYYHQMTKRVETLTKIYTKNTFDSLIDNYNREEYTIVNLLIETLNILDQEENVIEFFKQENRFPLDFFPPTVLDSSKDLQVDSLDDIINDLSQMVNLKSKVIDICVGTQLPVMLMYLETIIQKNIYTYFESQASENIRIVPLVYLKLLTNFVQSLDESKNAGPKFKELVSTFINLYFEPLVMRFFDENIKYFEDSSVEEINQYENGLLEQEKLEKDNIYKSILTQYNVDEVRTNKFELLTSFTKIFNKSNKESNEINYRVNFEVINKNLLNLKTFINFELCAQTIEKAKAEIELASIFNKVQNSLVDKKTVNKQIENIFISLVTIINNYTIKQGFDKAIDLLTKYDPNEFKSLESVERINTVEPLQKFTELINVGDLIQQMVEIFYENELVSKRIVDKNDFLNNANQAKKQFESTLDSYVADGLNIGIDKLMDEIDFLYNTIQLPNDFNPIESSDVLATTGPTKCATQVVELLSNHINLLNGSTETSIIDIFQQEIGERFFRLIVKNIKKRIISNTGSIILISDLNLYYDFVVNTLKQKTITPYFVGLKEIGQLYLISTNDAKELGKLIVDLSKFNGIFKQEELYEFVQKRKDWFKIKKHVENAMYGLGLVDCLIM